MLNHSTLRKVYGNDTILIKIYSRIFSSVRLEVIRSQNAKLMPLRVIAWRKGNYFVSEKALKFYQYIIIILTELSACFLVETTLKTYLADCTLIHSLHILLLPTVQMLNVLL